VPSLRRLRITAVEVYATKAILHGEIEMVVEGDLRAQLRRYLLNECPHLILRSVGLTYMHTTDALATQHTVYFLRLVGAELRQSNDYLVHKTHRY
jgi:hypothetical protein